MKSKTFKKLTAMLLAVMLVFGMCATGLTVSAAETTYVVAGTSNLCTSNWDGSATTSPDNVMTLQDDGTYVKVFTDVAVGSYQFKIVANGSTWYGVDGGNDNVEFEVTEVCDVTITFDPSTNVPSFTGASVKVPTGLDITGMYAVGAGTETFLNGASWNPAAEANLMTEVSPSVYEITYNDVAVGSYEFKFAANGSWDHSWGGTFKTSGAAATANYNGSNIKFTTETVSNVTLRLDLSGFKYATKTGAKFTVTIVDPTAETVPTEATEATTATSPVDAEYVLFGYINGANYGDGDDYETIGDYKFVDGKLTTSFNAVSYVGVKTADNANWYMTDGWAGDVTETKLYSTAVLGDTADKFMVPAGVEVTFTLVDNGDNTLTLSYVTGDPVETEPTEATEPTETEPTDPVAVNYVLFGYINGANYSDGDDYATPSEYVFVDGVLTTSFNETSYIGVKTSDNANWYMTDGWAGEVTEVVLYNTADLTTTADKLMVPGGVELTFTLVENEDGTLTLSYTTGAEVETTTAATEPTEDTEPTETEPTTGPVVENAEYVLFGNINGADYGDGDDYATIGDYKFVDGKLTATFDAVSYVGVKTTDNANWYMTNGWAGEVSEVALYHTSVLGETANKLMVPAGTVEFTLADNGDGSLTLSYVKTADPTPTGISIIGDIELPLADADEDGTYEGYVDLQAGVYTFKVNEEGVEMGNGSTFNDELYKITYDASFQKATTLNVTGGRYTFSFIASSNRLSVTYKPFSEIVELFGDINVTLYKSSGSLFTGSARLDAGSYQFRVNEMGVTHCFGYTFDDVVYKITYNSAWTAATTFNATGGLYSFKYDVEANQLTVQHAVAGVGDVRIFGDINVDLVKDYGTLYSATTVLEEGEYAFRVDELGTTMCNGSTFQNSIYKVTYSSAYKKATTFNAIAGKYTFRYDAALDQLTVLYSPLAQTVSIFGDIELELVKGADGIVYSASTELEAGTYAFRVDEFGTTLCYGGTFTDGLYKTYSKDFLSSTTLNATGGTYKFTFNTETNKLMVTKTA